MATMLSQVLAQRSDSAFFFADCEFQLFVDAARRSELLRAEQFQLQRGEVRDLGQDIFHLIAKTFVF